MEALDEPFFGRSSAASAAAMQYTSASSDLATSRLMLDSSTRPRLTGNSGNLPSSSALLSFGEVRPASYLTNGRNSTSPPNHQTSAALAAVDKLLAAGADVKPSGDIVLNAVQTSSSAAPGTRSATNAQLVSTGNYQLRAQSSVGGGHQMLQQLFDDMRTIEDTVDSIEIPARGRCRVYMAKYGYDPFKQSPNDNPNSELAFNAGDYILVFDEIDDDGYFVGELMDGRRGYVPSNWLDRLVGEDLFEFQASILYKSAGVNINMSGNTVVGVPGDEMQDDIDALAAAHGCYPQDMFDGSMTCNQLLGGNASYQLPLVAADDYSRMNDYVDLDDVTEIDDECLSDYERAEAEQTRRAVHPPQRLAVEKQLNKSILISWLHPAAPRGAIVSYQVYVDGVLKSTVPSADRTKALLEGVDSTIPHRISVRAIDSSGRHSNDAGCTIVTGSSVPFAPSCVRASHISSHSALISWLPSNSNFHHVVSVNSVEVQTLRPSVYKHIINGLSANTVYRVWVRAKPGKLISLDDKTIAKLQSLTTAVDFKTLPKSLPDPPVNVQVEAGPQQRSLLVTWLPITLNDFGSSNGCPVTGYAVFAGHKKLADIDSPTGDHALLDLADLEALHRKTVTVRTKSGENLSQDSMPCQIPDEYLKAGAEFTQPQLSKSTQDPFSAANNDSFAGNNHQAQQARHHHQRVFPSQQRRTQLPDSSRLPRHARAASGRFGQMSQPPRGKQLARSLQSFESDLDSRRSSVPQIAIIKELSGSDNINQTESYSEEEFENSMRIRAHGLRNKQTATRQQQLARLAAGGSQQDSNLLDGHGRQLPNLSSGKGQKGSDSQVRYFVALFDYDPTEMSPNPNANKEELSFKEGRIIRVYGQRGADGFYRGEINGRMGYVPCNVVSEITDPSVVYSLKDGFKKDVVGASSMRQQGQAQGERHSHHYVDAQGNLRRMVALYDYDPQEASPNADTDPEIPFRSNDVIYVYGKPDTDGFYAGEVERTKQRGLVPSNYIEEDGGVPIQGRARPLVPGHNFNINQMHGQPLGTNQAQINNVFASVDQQQNQQMIDASELMTSANFQLQQQANVKLASNQQKLAGSMQQASVGQQRTQMTPGMVTSTDGSLMQQNQGGQPTVSQTVTRPTSLSLGQNPNQLTFQQQQQMQQQQQPQQTLQGNQFVQMPLDQQQMRPQLMNAQQRQQQQQQLQSQHQMGSNNQQGGVLSNLLSSSKNMIGEATTPKAPFNQQQQFGGVQQGPMIGQMGQQLQQMVVNQQQQQQQHPQQQGFQPIRPTNTGNVMNNAMTSHDNQMHTQLQHRPNQLPQQQHSMQQPLQQQQHQFNHPMNAMQRQGMIGGGLNSGHSLDQHHNEFNIDGNVNQQGGNILSTVKNMFKL